MFVLEWHLRITGGDVGNPMLKASPIPLYYQVASTLRHRILGGEYRPGERLGSEAEMCREFQVSRTTVRQAFAGLEREGLVQRTPGRGIFVSRHPVKTAPMEISGFLEDILEQARRARTVRLRVERVPPDAEAARALQQGEGEPIVRIERVRYLAGSPFAHSLNHLPLSLGARISAEDLECQVSIMHILESELGVYLEEAIQTIEAVPAAPELAGELLVEPGAPLLLVRRTLYSGGRPVDYVRTHFRADRYRQTVRFGRVSR